MSNTLREFSNDLSTAVEKGGASTILVDARKRYPASGIAYAADLVLTAEGSVSTSPWTFDLAKEGSWKVCQARTNS